MATITTTTQTLESQSVIELADRDLHDDQDRAEQLRSLETDPNADAIMHASLLADSEVPDGGYGWVVVFSGAVIFWWFMGSVYTWGVMQAALVEQKNYQPATLSFVGSMVPALGATLAIPNATLIRKVGARVTGLSGVFLLGLGSILAGFAVDSLPGLFMTWGLVCGLGASLCFMTTSIIPAQYFKAKRGVANGVVYAGGGLGGTAVSFMLNALIDSVGIP